MASLVELKMPPRSTATWSSWTSLAAAAAAFVSSLALSSMSSSTLRPSSPPDELISSTTRVAVFATLGGEDTGKAVEVLDRGGCQEHPGPPYVSGVSERRRG